MRRASFKILHIDTSKIHLMCKGVAKWGNLAPGVTRSGASLSVREKVRRTPHLTPTGKFCQGLYCNILQIMRKN